MMNDDQKRQQQQEFLYHSIEDIRSTIQALDTKLHIVLGIMLLPLAISDKLLAAAFYWNRQLQSGPVSCIECCTSALAILAAILWLLGVAVSLRGLIALGNPAHAVPGERKPRGVFHCVGRIRGWWRPVLTRKLEDHIRLIPNSDRSIREELVFEQMKLGFIRDLKMSRHHRAAVLAISWLILSVIVMILYHMKVWS